MTEQSPGAVAALGISLNYELQNGRSLVLQTHIPSDQVGKPLDELLDGLMKSVERQAAKFEIEALKKNLEANERQLLQTQEDKATHESSMKLAWDATNRKGAYKPTPQQESAIRNFNITEKRLTEEIAKVNELIKEREQKIAA